MLQVKGRVGVADPLRVCGDLLNPLRLRGRIAILERGDCIFVEKVCKILCSVSSFEPYIFVVKMLFCVLRLSVLFIGNVSENMGYKSAVLSICSYILLNDV
jgi:hypothetical protein